MVGSIDTSTLRDRVQELAYELADAHAMMKSQQQSGQLGQAIFRAKQKAYALLRELETQELEDLFQRPVRGVPAKNSWHRLRSFLRRVRLLVSV